MFLLKIDPPQPCQSSQASDNTPCRNLSEYARAESEGFENRELRVSPLCHLHMEFCLDEWNPNPSPEEVEMERWSVARFVVEHYGGVGTAEVLGECPVDSIPPPYEADSIDNYETEEDRDFFLRSQCDDKAYYVRYVDEQGQERRAVAVLDMWFIEWDLYEFPVSP